MGFPGTDFERPPRDVGRGGIVEIPHSPDYDDSRSAGLTPWVICGEPVRPPKLFLRMR